jgi:hypothetical protein
MTEAISAKIEEAGLPAGVSWKIGGTYDDQVQTFQSLGLLMVLIVILVFIVMAAQFESLTYPFVIMFAVPFAFVGILIGLVITGTPLSIMGMVGAVMTIGIVVNNGIVLVDYANLNRERGMGIIRAVVDSGKSRLRPVLMTTLTTVLGMLPLALGRGEGSEEAERKASAPQPWRRWEISPEGERSSASGGNCPDLCARWKSEQRKNDSFQPADGSQAACGQFPRRDRGPEGRGDPWTWEYPDHGPSGYLLHVPLFQ